MNEQILRLFFSVAIGASIGYEREYREKAAGLRTITLVCMGSALFTMYAEYAMGRADAVRLAAGVVTGIGFLGAGVIMRDRGQVTGLTTAATIWVSAALGMGLGFGAYELVAVATVTVLLVLWLFPHLDIHQRANDTGTFEAVAPWGEERYTTYLQRFQQYNLKITKHTLSKKGSDMVCLWVAVGKPAALTDLARLFLSDPEVKEFNIG
jgi:putative Mg2+ transporter-C (MgtC) family protein